MNDFTPITLLNRLGQDVELQIKHEVISGSDYIFIAGNATTASSVVAKNAEQFARQLLAHFELTPECFNLIEVRDRACEPMALLHWRFDWYGTIAVKARSQSVTAERRINALMDALAA